MELGTALILVCMGCIGCVLSSMGTQLHDIADTLRELADGSAPRRDRSQEPPPSSGPTGPVADMQEALAREAGQARQ